MKTFWNKICRIFGVTEKNNVMSEDIEIPKKGFKDSLFYRMLIGDTETPLVSGATAEVARNFYLAKQFNEAMATDQKEFTITSEDGKKTYTFSKLKNFESSNK